MEWASSKGDMLHGRQHCLRKQKDGFIRVVRMCNLFHEVATTDNYRRDRLLGLFEITILSTVARIRLFKIARNDKFELPSALLP
jgi:hypothetical protein